MGLGNKNEKLMQRLAKAPGYALLTIWTVFTVMLIGWVVFASLSTSSEIFSDHMFAFKTGFHFENYVKAWKTQKVSVFFMNSLMYTVISCTLIVVIAAPAAYVLSRFRFKGNMLLQNMFASALGIPVIMIIMPLFGFASSLRLTNSRTVIIFLYTAINVPFAVFYLLAFFKNLSFTYEEALKKAEEALAVLGEDYLSRVKRAFSERWIDVYENQGKRSGAYSGGSYDTNAFMLLNWQDNLDNLFTLVHETGHSMHSSYTRETQPYVYGDYSIFLAEIASTTNENILTEKLLEEVEDDATRFAILNNFLDGFRGTVFRQTQFAEFEHAIHQADQNGEVLTSDFLNKLYADLNQEYYGLSKEDNPQIQYEWARIPHFYYNYYVYQYSTGFAAASALAEKIVHGSQEDRDRYIDYLKAGKSDYPLNVMRKAGVDMEKEDYLNDAFAVFERRLNEFEALVEKLGLA